MASSDRILIKAALNGGSPAPAPITPHEAAEEGRRAVEAGAAMVHVHARRPNGDQSSDPKWYASFLELFSAFCPGVLVSVTSKDSPGLLENVRSWNPAPPVCSVNVGSDVDPWVDLLQVLTSRTIAVEAGVANVTMIDAVNADPSVFCHAVVLADAEDRMSATRRYLQLRDSLREGGFDRRIIAHAYGDATWGVLATALACGDHVRVGFEDTPTLPTGRPAHSNGELVEILVQLARALGRTPLTPSDLSTDPTISTARAPRPLVS